MRPKTQQSIIDLLNEVTIPERLFPKGYFKVMHKDDGFLIQLIFWCPDADIKGDDTPCEQKCRKWYVSSHSTDSEVIRTAHKACEAAISHELDEFFLYRGARVFNPHLDMKHVAENAIKNRLDVRSEVHGETK